ncbi:MAG TPA: SDR family NAD(P)-dependent oxidoreductase [Chloroflexota bacterium]|nr:SDR family NAD(P)-dependent oxidoreductase [Chloroflexota bacterium]
MRTYLVTGAAGFIGSHVSQALLRRGDTVVGLDNLNDYYDPARKLANLAEIRTGLDESNRFVFVEGDIRDRALLDRLFAEYQFTAVAHLAAMAGVRVSVENPYLYYDVNLNGTLGLLDTARRYGTGNFVNVSTSSVYGQTQRMPFEESDPCDRPLAPYAASKRAAEMLGFTFHHLYGQNVTVVRFFTVYGPRGRPDMMAYKVVENIFSGLPVPLYNNGRMHRDWTYIDDIAAGVVAALDRPLGYEIINLGRGEPVLLADFVGMIERLAGRPSALTPEPMPDTDIPYTFADISRARSLLGYDPQVSVEEGVTRFWEWYRTTVLETRGAPVSVGE